MTQKALADYDILLRFVEVLQANLATEIGAVEDAGLTLPVPTDPDYYILSTDQIPEQIWRQEKVVVVGQNRPTRLIEESSGDGTHNANHYRAEVYVQVLINKHGYEPLTNTGRQQTRLEWLTQAASRLEGAVTNTIYKHAQNSAEVASVRLVDSAAAVASRYKFAAVAHTSWEVDYVATVPMDDRF